MRFTLPALLLASAFALGQDDGLQTVKAGDFTFKVPSTWEIVAQDNTLLSLVTPQEGDADPFRENLRVTATEVVGGSNIGGLMAESVKTIEKEGALKILGKGSLEANGHKVMWLSMKPKQSKPGDQALTLVEYGLVFGTKAYSFKAMAADKELSKFKAAVEKALKTLEPKGGK